MKVVAITGGPCAGKTSAMKVLHERLEQLGASAVFVAEAATDLIDDGIAPWTCRSMFEFQKHVMALQLERESAAFEQARDEDVAIVVCDRGLCDSHAYLTDAEYAQILASNGLDNAMALARYDAVFHLESVAKSNPDAYTTANNNARSESAEEAARIDDRIIDAWSGHPAFRTIGNRAQFADKAADLCEAIEQLLGLDKQTGRDDADDAANPAKRTGEPILVSACLLGEPCRYDGTAQPCDGVMRLADTYELVAVCPEQLGGLPTPRTPSEIQGDGRVVDAAGVDRTAAFEEGAREALRIAREHGCTRAILKANSPSCGVGRVYDGTFTGTLIPGMGKTASLLAEAGIDVASETEFAHPAN